MHSCCKEPIGDLVYAPIELCVGDFFIFPVEVRFLCIGGGTTFEQCAKRLVLCHDISLPCIRWEGHEYTKLHSRASCPPTTAVRLWIQWSPNPFSIERFEIWLEAM